MRRAFAFLISMLSLTSQAVAEPFNAAPSQYAETVNRALQQVGTNLRIRQTSCMTDTRCRFAAR